jgi:hypothetical protein
MADTTAKGRCDPKPRRAQTGLVHARREACGRRRQPKMVATETRCEAEETVRFVEQHRDSTDLISMSHFILEQRVLLLQLRLRSAAAQPKPHSSNSLRPRPRQCSDFRMALFCALSEPRHLIVVPL